jgi:hypothetical protein
VKLTDQELILGENNHAAVQCNAVKSIKTINCLRETLNTESRVRQIPNDSFRVGLTVRAAAEKRQVGSVGCQRPPTFAAVLAGQFAQSSGQVVARQGHRELEEKGQPGVTVASWAHLHRVTCIRGRIGTDPRHGMGGSPAPGV